MFSFGAISSHWFSSTLNKKMDRISRLLSPDREVSPAMNLALHSHLLSTVISTVPLKIGQSSVLGAGRGIFALEGIKAGSEVFRTKKALVTALDYEKMSTTCDFCYFCNEGEVGRDGRLSVAGGNVGELMACDSCKLMRYCSVVSTAHTAVRACL